MELDITRFFNEAAPKDYSASRAELGDKAGEITWGHAMEDSHVYQILDDEEKREAFRAFVKSSGGWDKDEVLAFTNQELEALLIQWISGDMREANIGPASTDADWARYEQAAERGTVSSRIFRSGTSIYFDIGS
jgi:hypothetical protein